MQEVNHLAEGHAVPFDRIREALEVMPYGSDVRVMFEMLFLTGCRISELDNMKASKLFGNVLYWSLGKNQHGFRKEVLPDFYLKELAEYRKKNRTYADRLFGVNAHTFRRYFHKFIMPRLKGWHEKRLVDKQGVLQEEYIYQLKGLRKDYQTLEFAKQLDKWKDAGVALQFTSKKMRHSCERITAFHYIQEFDSLNIEKNMSLKTADILKDCISQTRLMDFS